MAGAQYYTGFLLEADTNNVSKTLYIEDDQGNVHNFTSAAGLNNIVHPGQTQIEYAFGPFVAHLVHDVPGDLIPWRKFGIVWKCEPWPELTNESSFWMNLGTPQAKYLTGCVIPMDTNGASVTITLVSADGTSFTLPATTTSAVEKTPVAFAITVPFIVHEIQVIFNGGTARIWYNEIKWIYEVWPELTVESSMWMDFGTRAAKYLRAFRLPVDTNGGAVTITVLSDSGQSVTLTPSSVTTTAGHKVMASFAVSIPIVGHEFQFQLSAPCRAWYGDVMPDFDVWPEIIQEASGWLPIIGGAAAYLQGLVVPLEANGGTPSLSIITDISSTPVSLVATVTPIAFFKTSCAFSLATPVVAHQVQLLTSNPCRIWSGEIQWVAQPTPELAETWKTPFTGHGIQGFQSIPCMEVAYASTASVTLTLNVVDGTAPAAVTLPSTSGGYRKVFIYLTYNKFSLVSYSLVSGSPFQVFAQDWSIYIATWGRSGAMTTYKNLGGMFGDKAAI